MSHILPTYVEDMFKTWFFHGISSAQKDLETFFFVSIVLTMHDRSILAFTHSIWLLSVSCCQLPFDPIILAILIEFSRILFPLYLFSNTRYTFQFLFLQKLWTFYKCFEHFKMIKKISNFTRTKYIHVFLEKSCMKLKRYLFQLFDVGVIEPHRSEWMTCNLFISLNLLYFLIDNRCFFPFIHDANWIFSFPIDDKPMSIFWLSKMWRPL